MGLSASRSIMVLGERQGSPSGFTCRRVQSHRKALGVTKATRIDRRHFKAANVKHQRARATASRVTDEATLRALRCMR